MEHYAVTYYKEILNGEREKFPRYFWKEEPASTYPLLTRYLIEGVLKWDDEELRKNMKIRVLKKYKLAGMIDYGYGKTDELLWKIVDDVYPGRYQVWDFHVPHSYWLDKENCVKAVRWLIEEKLDWSKEDVKEKFSKQVMVDNGFTGLLKWGLNGSIVNVVRWLYPDIKPSELKMTSYVRDRELAIEEIRWFIEEKMGWSKEEIKENWKSRNIKFIYPVVTGTFGNSMYSAIDAVYPGEFKEWDFALPNGYWTEERMKEALKWFVEEYMGWSKERAYEELLKRTIRENGYRCISSNALEGYTIKEALDKVYKA